jgi:16S rRNA (uracil1498-N3)-methyltransferase
MRRVHLPPERIGAARAELTGEVRHYLRDVLRLAPGASVELFDGQGGAWEATIEPGFAALAVGTRREALASGPAITLLFALAKGEKNDLVVQKATELGAARLWPWSAERSVVKLDAGKGRERAERWRRIAEEAARQCGRSDVPEVEAPVGLGAALAAVPAGHRLVVLHGPGGTPLAALGLDEAPGVALVVGPEGGLTGAELAACRAAGAVLGALGPRTLRAETAAIVGVAVLQAVAGDLGGWDRPNPCPPRPPG